MLLDRAKPSIAEEEDEYRWHVLTRLREAGVLDELSEDYAVWRLAHLVGAGRRPRCKPHLGKHMILRPSSRNRRLSLAKKFVSFGPGSTQADLTASNMAPLWIEGSHPCHHVNMTRSTSPTWSITHHSLGRRRLSPTRERVHDELWNNPIGWQLVLKGAYSAHAFEEGGSLVPNCRPTGSPRSIGHSG